MDELHVTRLQRFLGHEVTEDMIVLHLRQADEGTADARQHVSPHVRQGARHVLKLVAILQTIPFIRPAGQEVIVVLPRIMTGVEEILLIVKTHGITAVSLLCFDSARDPEQEQHRHQEILFHRVLFIFTANIGIFSETTASFLKIY